MIYLIESSAFKRKEDGTIEYFQLLKIGYTNDNRKDNRFATYKMHNPTCEILKEIPNATESHENKLHYKFRNKKYEGYGNEWYYYDQEIIDYFNSVTLEDLNNLSNSESRNKRISRSIHEIRKVIDYLFDSEEEILNYSEHLINEIGMLPSYESIIEYVGKDVTINKEKLIKFNEIKKSKQTGIYSDDYELNNEVNSFFNQYNSFNTFPEKLRLLCEFNLSKEAIDLILSQLSNVDKVKLYYLSLGPEKLRSLAYNITLIKKEFYLLNFDKNLLQELIYSNFHTGDKILLSELKERLTKLYSSVGYQKTAKAIDITNWFEVKNIRIYLPDENGNKKQYKAYKLLVKKQ